MSKYYINSNSGDYIIEDNNQFVLHLITRYDPYQPHQVINITPSQFSALKGFVPIKQKKLFVHRQRKNYAPTLSGGVKGKSERVEVLSVLDSRDEMLKQLGL